MKEVKGSVYAVISAIIFGCMPIVAKYLYAEGCNAVSLVVYRYSLALPVLFILALREQAKDKKEREAAGELKKRDYGMRLTASQFGQFIILSLGFSLTPILLFSSYNYISSGSATTIHFSYPVLVILASIFIFKEKATWTKIASVVFCVIGLVLFYEPGQENGMMGILLALASGVTYTFYMMYFERSTLKFMKPFKTNFYMSLVSGAMVFVLSLVTRTFVLFHSARGWAAAFGFSFMLIVVACVLFQLGIAMTGAQKTAILSTFEPLTSIVLGVVCFGEAVGVKTGLGVLFILASVISITVFGRKKAT